jgi:hypothetical protein
MSHIVKKRRDIIDVSPLKETVLLNTDELSYAATLLAVNLLKRTSPESPMTRYQGVVGALESAKQEIFKKYIQPHELQARFENGEIGDS